MRRPWLLFVAAAATLLITAAPALACGGLIGPNGAVNLLRTTTFAGYHDGVEHYVTAFEFAGGGGAFGSITLLPGIPTDVVRGGGDWTLQRLVQETDPAPVALFADAAAGRQAAGEAEVILETIDALDITVLRGGGDEVGLWAKNHGFRLPPTRRRSSISMPTGARSSWPPRSMRTRPRPRAGHRRRHAGPSHDPDGQPVGPAADPRPRQGHGRGRRGGRLSPDRSPPGDAGSRCRLRSRGLEPDHSAPATDALLTDLRSDVGMEWVPNDAWLTKVVVDSDAGDLRADLAIDASGRGEPSAIDAGFAPFGTDTGPRPPVPLLLLGWRQWRSSGRCCANAGAAPVVACRRWPAHEAPRAMAGVATLLLAAAAIAGCAATPRTVTITIHYSEFDPTEIRVVRAGCRSRSCSSTRIRSTTSGSSATRRFRGASDRDPRLARRPDRGHRPGAADGAHDDHVRGGRHLAYICHLPAHEAYGMVGALMVEVDRDSYTPPCTRIRPAHHGRHRRGSRARGPVGDGLSAGLRERRARRRTVDVRDEHRGDHGGRLGRASRRRRASHRRLAAAGHLIDGRSHERAPDADDPRRAGASS